MHYPQSECIRLHIGIGKDYDMVRKFIKHLLVMMVAALAICALAMPALALSKDYACGFTLIPEDGSLFEGTEFYGRYLDDDPAVSADEEEAILEEAWMVSGFEGSRKVSDGPLELWLAADGTDGAQRIDLSAAQNVELANAQVTLRHYAGAEADGFVPANCVLIAYDKQTGASERISVTYTTSSGILNGDRTTFYYANFSGNLKDVLGIYTQVQVMPFDLPMTKTDIDGNTATYWHATIDDSELAAVHIMGQDKTDAFYSPINRVSVDGSIAPYFDEELGVKFYVVLQDACTIDEVSYAVGGTVTVLQPTGETDPYYGEYPVYQVPPTSAPVTITVTAHELQHWVNADGTITFEDDYLPKASKISFDLPSGATFKGVAQGIGGSEIRSPFELANAASTTTNGIDYYCFPDKGSVFDFALPEGFVLEGATLSPASAGTIVQVNPYGRVQVKLSAPATLTLNIGTLDYNHVDTDRATGVSVNLNSIDAQRVEGTVFCVDKVGNASELEKIKSAILEYCEDNGDDFSPNGIAAYDIAYKQDASDPYYYPLSGWCTYANYVTIPLPSGWDAATTRVFRYYNMFGDWIGAVDLAATTTVVDNGTALRITLGASSALGRFVLAREAGSTPVHAPGWAKENGGYYYYENDGTLRKNAWISYGGSWYYLGADGKLVVNGWASYQGKSYYMGANGKVTTNGWAKDGATGKYYYMNGSGVATVGWASIGGSYYYFNADGTCLVNGWAPYQGKYFYMGDNGKVVTNRFVSYNGSWYYVNGSGNAVVNDWVSYGGKWYHMGADGKPETDKWIQHGDVWYHVGANGAVDNSWKG